MVTEQVNDDRKDLEHENSIVEFLEGKLANAENEVSYGKERVEELERRMASIQVAPGSLELQQLQQLERRIATKLEELECPVCFTTCSPPIYTCPNQHLVCSTCRPHLATCPECRVTYGGQMRVHRYSYPPCLLLLPSSFSSPEGVPSSSFSSSPIHRYAERDAREVEEMRREVTTLRKSLYGRAQENAQVKAEEKMLIHVKEYNGHIKTFEVLPTNTVIEVMEFYDLSFRSPLMKLCNLSFFFKGKILQEDQTLEFYNIKNMDIINIIQ